MKYFLIGVFCLALNTATARSAYLVKQRVENDGVEILAVSRVPSRLDRVDATQSKRLLRSMNEFVAEGPEGSGTSLYQEVVFGEANVPEEVLQFYEAYQRDLDVHRSWPGSEVRTLVNQGDSDNRIDLTLVGDGYTANEKEKFFADAARITEDLFGEKTFASYLPLFNVHAVFVPSEESGLTDHQKVKTALGLYRSPKGSKRAVMPGNTQKIDKAIGLAPDTDYPILIANDDFYGGLGGRYAITTRSLNSGSMVLRHELGHNFGDVGEEYDGGSVYSGANSSSSASNVKWDHWVEGDLDIYETKFLDGSYVWKNLSTGAFVSEFNFPQASYKGDYLIDVIISSVGWASSEDVQVSLDGEPVTLSGVFTEDRSFFSIAEEIKPTPGKHHLEFKEGLADGDNVLAFAQTLALPADINKEHGHVGAYATFNSYGYKAGYRPTYGTCLMRDMRSMDFCSVDQENMWLKFLDRVSLVDRVDVFDAGGGKVVVAQTPELENLQFRWYRIGIFGQIEEEYDETGNTLDLGVGSSGLYRVEVEFKTAEIRKPTSLTQAVHEFQIF